MTSVVIPGFTGNLFTPTSSGYESAIQRFSTTAVLRPAFVAEPASSEDISPVLRFALSQSPPLELAVKGGGVNPYPASSSDGGLVLDLGLLNGVTVSPDRKSITVGGGALWGDVYAAADEAGVVVVGASVYLVGVGGSALAGGYSPLSGQYGLAIDNMIRATVVLADGRIITTDATNEPDLFWAIRGGVNQFGVVAEMIFEAHPSPGPITVGSLVYLPTELPNVLTALHEHFLHQDPSSKMILMFARSPPDFAPSILILPYIEENKTDPATVLEPFRESATPIFEGLGTVNNFTAVSHGADSILNGQPPRVTSDGALISDLWDDVVLSVFENWQNFTTDPRFRSSTVMWEFSHRDKIASVPVEATAFAARSPHYYMTITGRHTDPADDGEVAGWATKLAKFVKQKQVEKTGFSLATPASFAYSPETESADEVWDNMNLYNTVFIAALMTTASAWHLQLYRDANYIGVVEDRKGTLDQPCKNLGSDNVVTSMHWQGGSIASEIVLYQNTNCQGPKWATSGKWNVPKFPSPWDNSISSYKINY
ncbi:hypothetical protein PQX77_013732 [Marasmius sp. AFHP31]|nr:hypothetical protein PQX77_013732 [Marasmius sp. AFHP31]